MSIYLKTQKMNKSMIDSKIKVLIFFFTVKSWCESQRKRKIGVPAYEGSGSHVYRNQRYRFLVIPRYGIDIGKLFLSHRRKLPTRLVNTLAVQMVNFTLVLSICRQLSCNLACDYLRLIIFFCSWMH